MWRTAICYVAVTAVLSWTAVATPISVVGVTTGIDPTTHRRPERKNINHLYALGGPEWDLYILALSSFQKVNETDELSYFQISGIHGLPHSAWNGVENVPGAPLAGYCPHGELLFPTWHRPYVALFEQVLVSHAVNIANQYPPALATTYKAAAQTLRLPFWDWAFDPKVPDVTAFGTLTVNGPAGPTVIRNPLYSYQFQEGSTMSGFGGRLSNYSETIRCLQGDGQGNNITAANLNLVYLGLRERVYDAFVRGNDFYQIASTKSTEAHSFESPHNGIHTNAGCTTGTLSDLNWSAFDPLFMLHHCNVDRLVAMWQAINYNNTMFNKTEPSNGQFATPQGTLITADSPLKPFYDSSLNFYTSASVTNISTFGYTYPEIDDWSTTPEQLASFVRTQVNNLYGPGAGEFGESESSPSQRIRPGAKSRLSTTRRYYAVRVEVNRSELPLPATVKLLLNHTTVGSMSLLAMPSEGLATTSIPLRNMTLAGLKTPAMDWNSASSLLQQGLVVDIRQLDDTVVPVSTVPSLHIELHAVEYKPNSKESEFPQFGATTRFPISVRQRGNH